MKNNYGNQLFGNKIKLEVRCMKKTIASIIIFSIHLVAFSEPTPLVSRLMEEEASIFEIGLDRIDRILKGYDKTSEYRVSYDWDKNLIVIQKTIYADLMPAAASKKYLMECTSVQKCIKLIKSQFLDETGILCLSSDEKNRNCDLIDITDEFTHRGYNVGKFYKEKDMNSAIKELHNIIVLRLGYFSKNIKITCEKFLTDQNAKCFQK